MLQITATRLQSQKCLYANIIITFFLILVLSGVAIREGSDILTGKGTIYFKICKSFYSRKHKAPGTIRATSVERHSSVTRAARVVTIQAAQVCCNMPSSEDLVHLLLLSENSILKRRVVRGCKRGIKRWGVHPINRRRRVYGEYHHLIKQLKEDPERCCLYHSTMMNDTELHIPNFQFDVVQKVIGQGLAVPLTLSGAAHCRSPLKSIVTPLFTFARQHMGPDCKALAERCRSDARRSTLTARIVPGA
ncbi:hypothetical protein J6590_013366 [Homalodisca vitripennis]|nr:hypothetical protein J6590_013366 [Homalodisca vitripennis]